MLLAGCASPDKPAAKPAASEESPVRITQFYAEPVVAKGETTNLCYGVENAASVKLDPPVERVSPAIARCFPVDSVKVSKYTLTAADAQGRTVSRSIAIRTGPGAAEDHRGLHQ